MQLFHQSFGHSTKAEFHCPQYSTSPKNVLNCFFVEEHFIYKMADTYIRLSASTEAPNILSQFGNFEICLLKVYALLKGEL